MFTKGGSIDLTVKLPAGSHVEVAGANVDLHCTGRLGECKVRTAMGDLELEQTGDLDVRTASGRITVDSVTGKATVDAGSGTVELRAVDGPAAIKNTNEAPTSARSPARRGSVAPTVI